MERARAQPGMVAVRSGRQWDDQPSHDGVVHADERHLAESRAVQASTSMIDVMAGRVPLMFDASTRCADE